MSLHRYCRSYCGALGTWREPYRESCPCAFGGYGSKCPDMFLPVKTWIGIFIRSCLRTRTRRVRLRRRDLLADRFAASSPVVRRGVGLDEGVSCVFVSRAVFFSSCKRMCTTLPCRVDCLRRLRSRVTDRLDVVADVEDQNSGTCMSLLVLSLPVCACVLLRNTRCFEFVSSRYGTVTVARCEKDSSNTTVQRRADRW